MRPKQSQPAAPPVKKGMSEKGLPVLLGFLSAMGLLIFSVVNFFKKGLKWPLKYPDTGELTWPAASVLALGALFIFIHGFYFLFVRSPNAGTGGPRNFFRVLNWLGILMVLGAGLIPDDLAAKLIGPAPH